MITYIFLLTQAPIAARNEKLKIKNSIRQVIAAHKPIFFHTSLYFFLKQGEQGEQEKTSCASISLSNKAQFFSQTRGTRGTREIGENRGC
jgi:hypothetical protein